MSSDHSPPGSLHTRTEFLAWEAEQSARHEYLAGVVQMKSGGTIDQHRIAGNVHAVLSERLRGSAYLPFQWNVLLMPVETDDATYPDVGVTHRPVDWEDGAAAAVAAARRRLVSAIVLIEILPPRAVPDDFASRRDSYRRIAALRHYGVITQDEARLSLYSRDDPGSDWTIEGVEGLSAALPLPAIGVEIDLRLIYRSTHVEAAHRL
jgi:Uma2 family endonuclease